MGLEHCHVYHYDFECPEVQESQNGVTYDYHFSAIRLDHGSPQIQMQIWVFIWDFAENQFQQFSTHMGHLGDWKEVVKKQIRIALVHFGVDAVQIRGLLRDVEIEKEKHMIPWDNNRKGLMDYRSKGILFRK